MPIPTRSQSVEVKPNSSESCRSHTADLRQPKNALTGEIEGSSQSALPRPTATSAPRNEKLRPSNSRSAAPRLRPASGIINSTSAVLLEGSFKGHARNRSTSTQRSSHSRTRSDVRPCIPKTLSRPQSNHSTIKPTFNTYQQHYSPQKPRQAVNERPVLSPEPRPTPAQVTKLQDEVLQLSLVYKKASKAQQGYESSAREMLNSQFIRLRKEDVMVASLELEQQLNLNAATILAWEDSKNDKLQILATCIKELNDIGSEEGPCNKMMQQFNKWQEDSQEIITSRAPSYPQANQTYMTFIEPLNREWFESLVNLQRRLRLYQQSLLHLGNVDEKSSLGAMSMQHRQFAEIMLQEMEACQEIHDAVMFHQQNWTTNSLTKAMADVQSAEPAPRKGIWLD